MNLWEGPLYLLLHSWVVTGLSCKPVKTDLDGASWFSLDDPLAAQGVFIVAWPPRGQNDTRRPRVVAPTRSWGVERFTHINRGHLYLKEGAKRWAELFCVFTKATRHGHFSHCSRFLICWTTSKILHFVFPLSVFPLTFRHNNHYEQSRLLTFTLGNKATPHHLAFLQMACDGVRSLCLDKTFLTDHRDGAPQLEAVSKAPGIQWYARVRALITPKRL